MDIIEAMCPVLASIVNEYIPPMPRARQIINLEWDGRPNVGCYAAFFKQPTSTWNFKRLIQKNNGISGPDTLGYDNHCRLEHQKNDIALSTLCDIQKK